MEDSGERRAASGEKQQAQEAAQGLRCPSCYGTDLRQYYTRKRADKVLRVRICRHCGRRVQTTERVTG